MMKQKYTVSNILTSSVTNYCCQKVISTVCLKGVTVYQSELCNYLLIIIHY